MLFRTSSLLSLSMIILFEYGSRNALVRENVSLYPFMDSESLSKEAVT